MQRSAPSDRPVCILGAPGSPYSRKLRAVLRYRRIPHTWVTHGSPESRGLPRPRVALLPQLFLPGAGGALEARTDSTPLIRELETLHVPRTVTPPDPALAFVDTILEDYADEWLTKAMFWTPRTDLPDTLRALLAEVGRVYAPFLLANFAALERHADEVECTVDGRRWTQRPFRYQAKCLHELRRAHAALADRDRTTVDALLAGTGCDLLFAS
jgi:hypothetical protein